MDVKLRNNVPEHNLKAYEVKLARCRRLQDKYNERKREFTAVQQADLKRQGLLDDVQSLSKEEMNKIDEANEEKILAAFKK